jgi:hypothetical protein
MFCLAGAKAIQAFRGLELAGKPLSNIALAKAMGGDAALKHWAAMPILIRLDARRYEQV